MYNSENNRIVPNGSSYMYTNGYCPTYQSYPNQNYYSYTNADYQSSYPVRYNNHHTEQSTVPLNGSVVYSPVVKFMIIFLLKVISKVIYKM